MKATETLISDRFTGTIKAMGKRSRVISATALMVIGGFLVVTSFVGGSDLQAAGVNETGVDWAKYLIWGGAGALFISAILFISASAE